MQILVLEDNLRGFIAQSYLLFCSDCNASSRLEPAEKERDHISLRKSHKKSSVGEVKWAMEWQLGRTFQAHHFTNGFAPWCFGYRGILELLMYATGISSRTSSVVMDTNLFHGHGYLFIRTVLPFSKTSRLEFQRLKKVCICRLTINHWLEMKECRGMWS